MGLHGRTRWKLLDKGIIWGWCLMDQNNYSDYFVYHGNKYKKGTKIELTEYAINKFSLFILENGNIVTFVRNVYGRQDLISCLTKRFCYDKNNWIYFPPDDMHIKRIIKEPVEQIVKKSDVESAITNFKEKKKSPDIFYQCVAYVCIMAVSVIFIHGWALMLIETIIFIKWLVNQYKD